MKIQLKGMEIDPAELAAAEFVKSSKSSPNCDNCVEVAFVGEAIAVRDSKNPDGAVLLFNDGEWDAFLEAAANGELRRQG
jgi:hypothetical protein